MEILPEDKNIVAVIIAIEDYRFAGKDGGISSVKFAKNDATKFKELLIDHFGATEDNITLWIDEQATKTALEQELPYIVRQLSPSDKFIFYYAGHGFYNNDSNRLTVWDSHTSNLFGTSVSIDEVLLTPLSKSTCDNKLIFLDACSTFISNSLGSRDLISSMDTDEFEEFGNSSNYNAIFCSCSPGEKSFPNDTLKHGIWTWHLLEALRGNAPLATFKDEFITDTSLQNYLRKAVPDFITTKTTLRSSQTPYSKVSSSNTFIIRQLPPEIVEETTKEFPKIKLKFENLEMRKIKIENVKRLSGFKSGHFPPTKVGSSGNSYIQSISENEIKDEIQEVYENTKSILNLKRRDIQKESDAGGGSIENSIFRYFIEINQHDKNPALAVITRRLEIRVSRKELPADFNDIFPVQINEIVIPIDGEVDFDDLVEKFENLADEVGGELKEDDDKGIIVYRTTENLTITISTEDKEMIITPNVSLGCLQLIDYAAEGLKKITGQKLMLLP